MWCVPQRLGRSRIGSLKSAVASAGSGSKTSRPARSLPPWSAARSAAWSTTSPRAVLMRMALGFSRARRAALTSLRVSGFSARCSVTMSACRNTSSTLSQRSTPSCCAFSGVSERDQAMVRSPKACARVMTSRPIRPGADHPERLAEDAVGLGEFLLVPLVGAQGGDVFRDAAVNGQQQGEHQLGHGNRVLAGAVADEDAAGAGGLDVNGVDARPGAQHQRQLVGGLERVGGDLFAAHDQDLVRGDQPGQLLGLGGWLVGDFAAELVEAGDVSFGEFVGNESLHSCAPFGAKLGWGLAQGKPEGRPAPKRGMAATERGKARQNQFDWRLSPVTICQCL